MLDRITALLEQQGNLMFLVLVFLSSATFTLVIFSLTTSWVGVRRRATARGPEAAAATKSQLKRSRQTDSALQSLLPRGELEKSELRRFLNLAGYYSAAAPAVYQLVRIVVAVALGFATAFNFGRLYPDQPFFVLIGASLSMTLLGYMLPKTLVSMRRDKLCDEHRRGFPDFLDLLVICIEAGIGIDSAIERVGNDLHRSYPSLARNLHFMTLEMRAGRSTREALENLGSRLGIDEARSFATLIQQSEELGTSLVQTLRVYADEMRAKRLAKAEEKAHALPVKLVIPLGLFIFPVILGVTLMPVTLKLYKALGI